MTNQLNSALKNSFFEKENGIRIPLSIPQISGNEWKYVKECLDTGWVSSAGQFVGRFEQCLADYIGRKYAVACINGTAALHIALLVAGIQPEDEVIIPALSFIAPANAVRYVGAWPVFVDISADLWQLDCQKLADFITKECEYKNGRLKNRHTKRYVKAIIPVHVLGHPVDMYPLLKLAEKYNLVIIEDAAESLGACYHSKRVGSLGDVACFSFNGNKTITSGGGGMILTDREEWAQRARYLTTQAKDDEEEYIHNEIGFNYRLSNVQAALGLAQLERLDHYVDIKRNIARRYAAGLKDVAGLTLPQEASWVDSIFWLYTILVEEKSYGINSRKLLSVLKDAGIQTRSLWHPLNTLKPFLKCFSYQVEVAQRIYEKGLSLPSSIGLSENQQNEVIKMIQENNVEWR